MPTQSLAAALDEALDQARASGATLNERLGVIAALVRVRSPPVADAVERLIERLRAGHAGASAPGEGEEMPPFLLPDETGRLISLGTMLEQGPLAITFHRGHWCPYCRVTALAIAEAHRAVLDAGARMVAIAPERPAFARRLKPEASPFPMLTDIDNGYALSLGLAVWIGDEMARFYQQAGYEVPRYQGNDAWTVPIPATFVLAGNGMIVARHLDPDYRTRMEIDTLLAALRGARGQ